MPTYSTGHVIMRPAYMQTDVLVVGPPQSTAHRAIDLFLSYPEVGQHVTVLAYTVILKDSYTLTPNLNMKKWF